MRKTRRDATMPTVSDSNPSNHSIIYYATRAPARILGSAGKGILVATAAGVIALAPGCDIKRRGDAKKIDEITDMVKDMAGVPAKLAEGFDTRMKKTEEKAEETGRKVDELSAKSKKRHTELNEGLSALAEAVRGASEDSKKRLASLETTAEELSKAAADRTAGILDQATYMNGYSMTRVDEGDGRQRITIFNKERKPLQVVDLRKYDSSLDFLSAVFKDEDKDGDGEPDFDKEKGGLYEGRRAMQVSAELEEILRALKKKSAEGNQPEFDAELEKLREMGDAPTHPRLDERARNLLEIFRAAGGKGTYDSDSVVAVPGTHLERDEITINRSGTNYIIMSGSEALRYIEILDDGSPAAGGAAPAAAPAGGPARIRVTNRILGAGAPGAQYELKMPVTYLVEMVEGWANGNQRGKDAAKKKKKDGETRERKARLTDDYERGVRVKVDSADSGSSSTNVKISGGGTGSNYSLEVNVSEDETTEGARARDNDSNFVHARADLRFGTAPTGMSADTRKSVGVDVFHSRSEVDTTEAAGDPEVSLSTDGRFETTRQSLGGTEGGSNDHFSFGVRGENADGSRLLNLVYFEGSDSLDWSRSESLLIRDLAGIIPDITTQVDISGSSRKEKKGGELLFSLGNVLLFAGTESGDLEIGDGTSLSTIDISDLRLGTALRLLSNDNWKLTLGGVYTQADVGGTGYDGGDVLLAVPYAPNNSLIIAPRLGATFPDSSAPDSTLWRGGCTLVAGGNGSADASKRNLALIERNGLDSMLSEWSRQYTPEADAILNGARFYQMLTNLDANVLLSLDAMQVYGADGNLVTGGEARLALMGQINGDRRNKLIVEGLYSDDGFEKRYGGGVGYAGRKAFVRVSSERREGLQGDKDNLTSVVAGFRF